MLSRVADALFWMSRYLERAEQIARLLDATIHLDLDLHGIASVANPLHWRSLETILQQPPVPSAPHMPLGVAVGQWLTFGQSNQNSIMACINRARNNARSIRGAISSEMWRELNKLYWQLRDPRFRQAAEESPYDLLQAVQVGCQLIHGVCDATLVHDEGWQFIRIGKHLERSIHVLRIVDVKHKVLRSLTEPGDLSLANLHWASVLRCCNGYEAYQRLYISRVEPERVVTFLIWSSQFPQALRHNLTQAAKALVDIRPSDDGRDDASRILGRLIAELEYSNPDQIIAESLSAFLESAQRQCGEISLALQRQFALNL